MRLRKYIGKQGEEEKKKAKTESVKIAGDEMNWGNVCKNKIITVSGENGRYLKV